jgi:glutaredoxin-like protein NrdH
MTIRDFSVKVNGKKREDILMFTLSTCVWCMKTKKLLKQIGIEYNYIDVDTIDDKARDEVVKEFSKWNPDQSFPTIVIDNKKCIIGFQENQLREL